MVQSIASIGLLDLGAEKRTIDAEGICRMGIFPLDLRGPDEKLSDRNDAPYNLGPFSECVVFWFQLQNMQSSLSDTSEVK